VLLILLGFLLLILEVKVTTHGGLAIGGIICLLMGSLMLIDSPLPEMQIGLRLIISVVASLSAILLLLVTLGVRAQRQPAFGGESGMLQGTGNALTAIEPGGIGRVATHGEIWSATASEPIQEGDRVAITAVKGLTLTVRRI
jgi:membrane-bound serine protease (ClpP class)